jgi:hypothetical protein
VLLVCECSAYDPGVYAYWSAIRLISGDGTAVHATTLWDDFEGTSYAPYLFAGLAMADLDEDGLTEIVTIVRAESTLRPATGLLCYVAIYEVDGTINLEAVSDQAISCESHAPAVADLEDDGQPEIILGNRVYDASSLSVLWTGTSGAGWFNDDAYGVSTENPGYWNSGYHSFAYDMDGDGTDLEVVAGNTVYNSDGSIYCTLRQDGELTADGYPAVADVIGDDGQPEIVISGNHFVAIFEGSPDSDDHCNLIAFNVNKPEDDFFVADDLPAHPDCDEDRPAFGGQPTVADFTGDGSLEIGVAGSCWYSIYEYNGTGILDRLALTPTRDWSSASTGATVFDFNGDGAQEVVFSDEEAVYVWWVDASHGLEPWERMVTLLEDTNHKSWTIHEYPLVADVDGDGKAEIIVVNSHLQNPDGTPTEHYGIYVMGAANDDWVSARSQWNQHAYYITNIHEDGTVGYAPPNFAPETAADYNSFRSQAPGDFGALAAPNIFPVVTACQDECGALTVWVQGANESEFIGAREDLSITLYGVNGPTLTAIDEKPLPWRIEAGKLTKAIDFILEPDEWTTYESLKIRIDEPDGTSEWGGAHECDEDDNSTTVSLDSFCE